jgi:hypothetical protein
MPEASASVRAGISAPRDPLGVSSRTGIDIEALERSLILRAR